MRKKNKICEEETTAQCLKFPQKVSFQVKFRKKTKKSKLRIVNKQLKVPKFTPFARNNEK